MTEGQLSLAETKRLGIDLLTSRSNVNNAPLLLSILSQSSSDASSECRLEALNSLHAFFIPLLRSGKLVAAARNKARLDIEAIAGVGKGQKDAAGDASRHAEVVYRLWVWNKYREFTKSVFRIVSRPINARVLQVAAINTLMDLVREERTGEFSNSLYLKICSRMLGSTGQSNEILQVLIAKYFKYSDVIYFTYSNVEKLSVKRLARKERDHENVSSDEDNNHQPGSVSLHTFVRNVYDVLSHLPPPPSDELKDGDVVDELWGNSLGGVDSEKMTIGKEEENRKKDKSSTAHKLRRGKDAKKHKVAMSKAWLAFLQLSLPLDTYKKVLARLHQNVIPYMTNPILLSDFLTKSYNVGGLIGVMALSSLFILITKYGLEYPEFYNKLYALLEPSIFVARYRSHFFELLDTSLKSSHLPGYLGAAFAKRLGRLVLSAPPSGAIVVIALIHNLLRRHPSINVLVHRAESNRMSTVFRTVSENAREGDAEMSNLEEQGTQEGTPEERLGIDPFVAAESDTSKCNALKSSLWEIESLRRHYCPAVSRFVESLETDLTVRAKTTEVAIRDFSSASYATIFEEEVGRRLKSVPVAFYSTVPSSLFPEGSFDGSFDGWRFSEPPALLVEDTGKFKDFNSDFKEQVDEDSVEEVHSEELSSDGSRGSRSRSEESGEDWPQPLLKRVRNE